ncbi:MAG: tetratricopeptide repeat protein [Anaerolineae bacterium]|nr:tetratricopeptide repeat protein [Anaerolineae bacterium]
MAKISLRIYTKEIENLIDRGQTDEAIAHCKYVLKQFPKHIDTYRLLGKAYLESRRYTEASDIFRRLLSVIPDDFVANLGMSIIKEDENNLDSAIWHMERAFEFQPSNPAIQSELQRLRSRRDGIEPPKVRLTRGALVRMYERGELYPQAIAEIKAALAEDPKRIDLLVTLARVYYLANQKVEAIETCIRLISKLPFCFEANRILAEVLPSTSRAEDALVYRQRLNALDPYSAFLSESVTASNLVPDNAVLVERLDWQPIQSETQPQWAQSVGVTLDEQNGLPSIIEDFFDRNIDNSEEPQDTSDNNADRHESQSSLPQAPAIPENEEIIPDWMSNAGWAVAHETTIAETAGTPQEEGARSEEEKELSPANIPDWLQSLAPSDSNPTFPIEGEQQKLEILESILPVSESSEKFDLEQEAPTSQFLQVSGADVISAPPFEESVANQVMEGAMDNTSPFENLPQDEEDLPDWLKDLADEEKSGEDQDVTLLPDQEPGIEQKAVASSELDEAMAWLESLAARQGADDETLTIPPELRKNNPPDWVMDATSGIEQLTTAEEALPLSEKTETDATSGSLSLIEPESPTFEEPDQEIEGVAAPPTPTVEDETAFSWLESLAARQGADENTLIEKSDSRSTNPPVWVSESSLLETGGTELSEKDSDGTYDEIPNIYTDADQLAEELPEWLKDIEQPAARDESTDSLPDWLKETESQASADVNWISEAEAISPPAEQEEQSTPTGELPAWLKGLDDQPPVAEVELTPESANLTTLDRVEAQDLGLEENIQSQVSLESPESIVPQEYMAEISTAETPEPSSDVSSEIESARQLLESGQIEAALEAYNHLIENHSSLEEVIQHLQEALYRYPVDIGLWQSLGDALAKTNRLQEALDAYTKAEELLK